MLIASSIAKIMSTFLLLRREINEHICYFFLVIYKLCMFRLYLTTGHGAVVVIANVKRCLVPPLSDSAV